VNKCEKQKRVPQQVAGESWKLRAERKLQTSSTRSTSSVSSGDFGDAIISRSANEVQGRAAARPQLQKVCTWLFAVK
jgi:hypothetical protein